MPKGPVAPPPRLRALFDRRLKWLARITWLRTLLFIVAGEVGLVGLLATHSTKQMIGFAALLLSGFVAVCVIDLQYRITNTKVGLLKEIKLLRLEYLGQPTGQAAASLRKSDIASTNLWRSLPLSLGEDLAWYAALVLLALSGAILSVSFPMPSPVNVLLVPTVKSYVTLAPDGAGTEVVKVAYTNTGWVPRTSFPFTTGDAKARIRWIDSQGRELPATVSTSEGQQHYTVQLVEPVMPFDHVRYTQITETPASATRKDDLWTCRGERSFGAEKEGSLPVPGLVVGPTLVDTRERKAEFSETVQVPNGAEIVNVDPKPLGLLSWNGTLAPFFTATRGRNEAFTYTIQYRLPKESTQPETTK